MITISLPDGSTREYDQSLSVYEVAASIGFGLAKAAVAGRVNGVLVDCGFILSADARVSIVTPQEPDGLEILRRSCGLMLAAAVKQLHPEITLLNGSALGDGFFHEYIAEHPLTLADLTLIAARMRVLAATNHSIRRREATSVAETSSSYVLAGVDCASTGPHVPATKVLQSFTLDHLSRSSPQRIYGTCWPTQEELEEWTSPPHVVVINMDGDQAAYAQSVTEALRRSGVRAASDLRHEKIRHKIRHHSLRAPYLVVIGEKEQDGGFVSVRSGTGENFGRMAIEALCLRLSSASFEAVNMDLLASNLAPSSNRP